jgi:hypothetical protein
VPRLADDAYRRTVVRRVEDHILSKTGNLHERLVLLDAEGRPLLVKDGTTDGIELTEAEVQRWQGRADLATHNHRRRLSFTVADVATAMALGVREVNAFAPELRYRLVCRPTGQGWPPLAVALAELQRIDSRIRRVLAPRVARGQLGQAAALALHRHTRWQQFAERFAHALHYEVEER